MSNLREISLRERIRLNLVSAMENANVNQVQLAERLGISKGTVNNWARGNNSPDVDMVPKICNVLGISITALYSPTIFEATENAAPGAEAVGLRQEEVNHIKKYRLLDQYGKEAVDGVLDVEWRRCMEEPKRNEQAEPETVYFVVPGFISPMSAGTGQPAWDNYPENYKLTKEPPRGTTYIARVSGQSMQPTYQDGDLVFVHYCERIDEGKVGVFFMDGQQWIKERGEDTLISHNPDPQYAPRPMTEDIRCQGLVLGVCDESYFE